MREIVNAFSAAFLLLSRAAVTAGLTVLAAQTAQAQVPKTIRIVVPFPAGGPTDTTARVIAEYIGKLTGT
jgi:tripartite-type tricarboxylate transporter receptor subunit TctC